jgi:hypothetical protein
MNRNRILSILHIGKDYLNLYLKEMILINIFKNLFNTKVSDEKFSYLTQTSLNDNSSISSILIPVLNAVNEDIIFNENLLLLYNKEEIEIEFTLDSKN